MISAFLCTSEYVCILLLNSGLLHLIFLSHLVNQEPSLIACFDLQGTNDLVQSQLFLFERPDSGIFNQETAIQHTHQDKTRLALTALLY
jgi:hypothetical protein